MEPLPTIRQLQYLAALAEDGSFSRAAARCNVTQSTLSAGIADLETLLRRPVADRARRRATLTAFGREVLEEGRIILAHAQTIAARARALESPLSGPLRIGVIPTIAPYLLPLILPPLRKRYPALEPQLAEDRSAALYEKLRAGALDIVLLALPYDAPGMTHTELLEEPFHLACPHGSWTGSRPAATADLAGKTLLLLDEGHCLRDHALAACRFQAQAERGAFRAASLPTLLRFVQLGYGITVLPDMAVRGGALPEGIDIIPFRTPAPARKIGLIWRDRHPQERDFTLLAATIREILGKKQRKVATNTPPAL